MIDDFGDVTSDNVGLLPIEELENVGAPEELSGYNSALDSVFVFLSKINEFLKEYDPISGVISGVDAQRAGTTYAPPPSYTTYAPPPSYSSPSVFNSYGNSPSPMAGSDNARLAPPPQSAQGFYNSYNSFPSPSPQPSYQIYWTEHTQPAHAGFKYDFAPPPPPQTVLQTDAFSTYYPGTGQKSWAWEPLFSEPIAPVASFKSDLKHLNSEHKFHDFNREVSSINSDIDSARFRDSFRQSSSNVDLWTIERDISMLKWEYNPKSFSAQMKIWELERELRDLERERSYEQSLHEYRQREKEREKESDERFQRMREEDWFFQQHEKAKQHSNQGEEKRNPVNPFRAEYEKYLSLVDELVSLNKSTETLQEFNELLRIFNEASGKDINATAKVLSRFYAEMQSRNIPINQWYIHNILTLPLTSINNILRNGVAEDVLRGFAGIPRPDIFFHRDGYAHDKEGNNDSTAAKNMKPTREGMRIILAYDEERIKKDLHRSREELHKFNEARNEARVKYIGIALARFRSEMQSRNIPIDERYMRNILTLPLHVLNSVLRSGIAEDVLRNIPRTPEPSAGGGGDDGDENAKPEKVLRDFIRKSDIRNDEEGKHNGHTIKRHVEKTQECLEKRIKKDPNISGATSFPNIKTANKYIRETLDRNIGNIVKWLRESKEETAEFRATFTESVGYGFNKQGQYFDSIKKVKIVLQRTPDFFFKIVTAFPDVK